MKFLLSIPLLNLSTLTESVSRKREELPVDRYAIRLVDETAQIDITLWEAVGHRVKRLREGHFVLISGLSTSKIYKDSKGRSTWYVNGSTNCDTKIINGKRCSVIAEASVPFSYT